MSSSLLSETEAWLKEEVRPIANELDQDPLLLRRAFDAMAERSLLALRVPAEFGGPETPEDVFREFQELIARYSGSLAFLQTQHQSAANILMKSTNQALREELLPKLVKGERRIGLGFSQLRRPGEPIMKAFEGQGGYRLSGHAPWVTGQGFFDSWLVGAQLPDGSAVFGLTPFAAEAGITFSEPMKLAAFQSGQTVTCDLDDWLLAEDQVVFVKRPGWIQTNDMINITLQGWFALGCARAGLDVMEEAWRRRRSDSIRTALDALEAERMACREALTRPCDPEPERLKARAWVIDLAVRCAHAAVVASSGASNSLGHPAQRVFREALVFSVTAQTGPIMEATLARLIGRGQPFG